MRSVMNRKELLVDYSIASDRVIFLHRFMESRNSTTRIDVRSCFSRYSKKKKFRPL